MTTRSDKFYVMAPAASGKSTFAGKFGEYAGCRVVDFEDELPEYSLITKLLLYFGRLAPSLRKIAAKRPDMVGHMKSTYFDKVFDFVLQHEEPLILLGRKTPDDFDHDSFGGAIKFSVVVVPEADHRRNCAARKKQMRNPLPFLHHWTTDFDKVRKMRKIFEAHAEQHGLPVHESFESAVDAMRQETVGDLAQRHEQGGDAGVA